MSTVMSAQEAKALSEQHVDQGFIEDILQCIGNNIQSAASKGLKSVRDFSIDTLPDYSKYKMKPIILGLEQLGYQVEVNEDHIDISWY